MEPRGILRNKDTDAPTHSNGQENLLGDLDRQEVIRNTRYNAQLVSESKKGDRIRAQIAEFHLKNGDNPEPSNGNSSNELSSNEHLKWDEINLYKTEQEKAATMRIDEPKTPYEGGFDPTGEYYQDDEITEPIPDFNLGEGLFKPSQEVINSLHGGEILQVEENEAEDDVDDDEDEEESKEPLLAEERHKHFDDMRKAHYHNAANPLKHKIDIPDDDEEDKEEEDDDEEEEDE